MPASNTTPYGRLNLWAYQIIRAMVRIGRRLDGVAIGLRLWDRAIRKNDSEVQEVLGTEGAHQFGMKALQRFQKEPTKKQLKDWADKKQQGQSLFIWGGVELPQDEYDLVSQLDFYQIKTKTWGYVFVATATWEQLDEAISLRAAQITTMRFENDILANLRDLRR
jgi:hypothetical protein